MKDSIENQNKAVSISSATRCVIFVVAFAAYLAVGYAYSFGLDFVSTEGLVRTGVAADMLCGRVIGRQGVVCSINFTPIPTLAVAALGIFDSLLQKCFAAVAISALFGALAVALFDLLCMSITRSRAIRYLLVVVFFLFPAMIVHAASGTSTTMLVCCALALLYFGREWALKKQVKHLLAFAVLTGLSPMVNWRGFVLGVIAATALAVTTIIRGENASERKGLLWVLVFPFIYMIATWIGLNWVTMGIRCLPSKSFGEALPCGVGPKHLLSATG